MLLSFATQHNVVDNGIAGRLIAAVAVSMALTPLLLMAFEKLLAPRMRSEEEERERLVRAIAGLSHCDFIVLDTPGSDQHLSREGHSHADILITPLNDSFVDLDMLGRVDMP